MERNSRLTGVYYQDTPMHVHARRGQVGIFVDCDFVRHPDGDRQAFTVHLSTDEFMADVVLAAFKTIDRPKASAPLRNRLFPFH